MLNALFAPTSSFLQPMKSVWKIIHSAALGWIDHNATTHAAALSFFAILSIAPLAVISIAIIGFVFGEDAARGQIVEQIESLTGREAALTIQSLIESSSRSGSAATLVGFGLLLFGASAVFVQVQTSLNTIWGMKEPRGMGILDFFQRRALSFAMTLGVGFILLASLLISAWLAAAEKFFADVFPQVSTMDTLLDIGIPFVVLIALFALVFKLLPDVKISWRDVWAGSAITALLFILGKQLIGLYLGRSAVTSAYGAAGSLIAVLLWIYYSALIFYFGAEFTQAYARILGSLQDKNPGSPPPSAKTENQT